MDRLIVDIGSSGAVDVSFWREGEVPRDVGSVQLTWPLTDDDGESLRWYVEDFLRAPFGVYEDRGPKIQGSLRGWGELVFSAVFGTGPIRDAFVGARANADSSGRGLEVVFQSSVPGWLGLPWELMWPSADPEPLVLGGVSVARALPSGIAEAFHPDVNDDRLRVLMVISRPGGEEDVGFQMIARPLLQRLEAVRGQVELTVLRPPTLDALKETVQAAAAAGRPFQVVHFDGHGVMPSRNYSAPGGSQDAWAGPPVMFAGEPGVLVFEKPEGGAHPVSADVVGQVLAGGRVPLVVLNACESGAVGKELEAAVATRLMQGGAAAVVAMAYSVYAVAAAEFMATFYERLFAGGTVAEAVAAGRAQLVERPLRPSPKGELALADWFVPVHYTRREISFPTLEIERPKSVPSLETLLDQIREETESSSEDALAPVGEFIGRDGLFYSLEVALPLQRVVVLKGPGGTGKTELAKAFGRWWRDTGGVDEPRLVIWHSFEPGVTTFGLEGVITSIGLQVFGSDFARLDSQQRRQVVDQLLKQQRLLLIWDNFETVHSMPDPNIATPPLDDDAKKELAAFVHQLTAGGRSALIITSRHGEDWLGGTLRRVEVGGLIGDEVTQYADQILAPYPTTRAKRQTKVFAELLQWLDGHPLSMRLILPHLEASSAADLLQALQGLTPMPGGDDGGRLTSLPASITYSFTHLPDALAGPLIAVSLFRKVTDPQVLASMSTQEGCPARFTGPTGGSLERARERWVEILDTAAAVGLLTHAGRSLYRIHPALPGYLARRWQHSSDNYYFERTATQHAVLVAFAGLAGWVQNEIAGGDAGAAFAVIDLHQANLNESLSHALHESEYELAQAIIQPLSQFWAARGLTGEADSWADKIRDRLETGDTEAPSLDTDAGALWLFIVGEQANRQQDAGLLDQAEQTQRDILTALTAQPKTREIRTHMATALHQLGTIAQDWGRLAEAEDRYRKSSIMLEELGDRPGLAASYYQLGWVAAQNQSRLDEAQRWTRKSLTIAQQLEDQPAIGMCFHQLGIIAQLQFELDESEDSHLADAEDCYHKSLIIFEALHDRPKMASAYHELGTVARLRSRLDDAERWIRESLTIAEDLGDRPRLAQTYCQLGLLAGDRDRFDEAFAWMIRSITLFPEFPSPLTDPAPHHLRRLTASHGIEALEEAWTNVTGAELPSNVRAWVEAKD